MALMNPGHSPVTLPIRTFTLLFTPTLLDSTTRLYFYFYFYFYFYSRAGEDPNPNPNPIGEDPAGLAARGERAGDGDRRRRADFEPASRRRP